MDISRIVTNLIKALQTQGYSFEDYIHADAYNENFNYQSGIKKVASNIIQAVNNPIISYNNINKETFNADFLRFQQSVDDQMLFSWAYKSGALSIVGIIDGSDLLDSRKMNDSILFTIFSRFDNGVTNIMRKYVGQANGQDLGTYGTMIVLFNDQANAQYFNLIIRDFYSSHFMKSTFISAISIDCVSQTLTQGKSGLFGAPWQGGIDVTNIKQTLFR